MQALERAIGLHGRGELAEAERIYRAVLADDPQQADAQALLGVLLAGRGQYAEARLCLDRAVERDPDTALFRFYRGNMLFDAGDYHGAAENYRDAATRKDDFADAYYRLALACKKIGLMDEAVDALRRVMVLQPANVQAQVLLAECALAQGEYDAALQAAQSATGLQLDNVAALVALALALDYLNREEEAIAPLQQALRVKPDFIAAQDMLATTLQKLNRLDEAEAAFHRAITLADGAIGDDMDEVYYTVHHWNLALLQLLRGDFRRGFAHYRARFKIDGKAQRLPFPRPLWQGEDVRGKKILVVGEQGFGDVLMLCRYGALLRGKGAWVVFLVHTALVSLLRESAVADEVISDAPAGQGDFDYQTSIFDLPYRFGTTVETIPAAITYLPLPASDAATKLADNGRLKVGVVWAGRPDYGDDRRRSLPLDIFAALFRDFPGVDFFSLMRDIKPGDIEILAQHAVIDLSAKLTDFLATARLVGQLDLVITCDTAMAHLAGGMGKKTWLLLPFAPDWRWLTEREDSPWYPTLRLFRQRRKADWGEVVGRVREELEKLL